MTPDRKSEGPADKRPPQAPAKRGRSCRPLPSASDSHQQRATLATRPDSALGPVHWPDDRTCRSLRRRVLTWFNRNQRPLPWRQTRDPYAIWVSEIMLQQTQVVTVLDYWPRFIKRFPNVSDLAEADEPEVLRYWEGLGYYRRAKQMHAAAKQIVEQHGGQFPESFAEVLALPGVGRYTAGAVLSIALGQSLPILEGNTQRLYSRLLGLQLDPTTTAAQRILWEFAEHILPRCNAGAFNQGLMEIGGQLCKVHQPQCDVCPLQSLCPTFANGWQDRVPAPKQKKTRWEPLLEALLIVRNGDDVLVRQAGSGERWAGLWDFVRLNLQDHGLNVDQRLDSIPATTLQQIQNRLAEQIGLRLSIEDSERTIQHGVTRFRIRLHLLLGQTTHKNLGAAALAEGWQWKSRQELTELPLNITARKWWNTAGC